MAADTAAQPATGAPATAGGCVTEGCHRPYAEGLSRHPADGACQDCHHPREKEAHPGGASPAFRLAESPCLGCHDSVLDQETLHPPAAAADCLICHNYHGEAPMLLAAENAQSLCRACHQPVVREDDTFIHGPVSLGNCNLCHRAHGSRYPNLLRANFSRDYENDYNDDVYALCFRCHKIDLLLHPKTSYNTNFRDGKNNLHYLHVNRESAGRSCKLCHEIHAGRRPKLMADTVSYGAWAMPVNFEKTETGGRCAPGCHAPAEYNHTRPTAGPVMATPPPESEPPPSTQPPSEVRE